MRLTFLARFTIVTLLVSMAAALVLALTLENAQRSAISTDYEVAALGRVSAVLTGPIERVAGQNVLTAATTAEFSKVAADAGYFQNVTAMRIYRPNGSALYPAGAPSAAAQVSQALRSDTLVRFQSGDTITAYSPYFTTNEKLYVIAIDFSAGQLAANLHHERRIVFAVVGGVVIVIFCSLVTLAAGASRELERRRREAGKSFIDVLAIMADTIELRDPYTAGHSARVAAYSRKLAHALGLSPSETESVEHAALLHDIGKIAVPDTVLFKPTYLDEDERRIMNKHPTIGGDLISRLPSMHEIEPCVRHHHERIDGNGYPAKLLGLGIPRGARIIAVADTFDAMTTDRPYRHALSIEVTLAELDRVAGTQLDAAMVRVFKELVLHGAIVPPEPFISPDLYFGRSADPHAAPAAVTAAVQSAPSDANVGVLLAAGGRPSV